MRSAKELISRSISLCLLAFLTFQIVLSTTAQAGGRAPQKPARPAPAVRSEPPRDAQIAKLVKEIDARNIESTIRKLVSFGTRNTLSEQDNPTRGIGAARDWIFAEFQKINADCANCLVVEKQSFL